MAKNDYALDQRDLATDQFVEQLAHQASAINSTSIKTKSVYKITDVALVKRFDKDKLGTPVDSLALRLRVDLTDYESQKGRMAKLVDMDLDHHKPGEIRSRKPGTELLYKLNTPEIVAMYNGGLNDYPRQYVTHLKDELVGTTFSRPDTVQVTEMQFKQTETNYGSLQLTKPQPLPTQVLYAVNPNTKEHQFDSLAKDNTFTFTLNKTLEKAVEDYKQFDKVPSKAPEQGEVLTPQAQRAFDVNHEHQDINYDKQVQNSKDAQNQVGQEPVVALDSQHELHLDDLIQQMDNQTSHSEQQSANANVTDQKVQVNDEISFDDDDKPVPHKSNASDDELEM